MFYLETKDGDKFFTNKDSDDRKEFEKILEDKLGQQVGELFNELLNEATEDSQEVINSIRVAYKDCIDRLDEALMEQPADIGKLEEILSDLQALYVDCIMLG